jgi:hypothetical protein
MFQNNSELKKKFIEQLTTAQKMQEAIPSRKLRVWLEVPERNLDCQTIWDNLSQLFHLTNEDAQRRVYVQIGVFLLWVQMSVTKGPWDVAQQ